MTSTQLAALSRYKTRTTSTSFSDADMLVVANAVKDRIASQIAQVRPEIFNTTVLQNLVADTRKYDFPDTSLIDVMNNIVRLELKFSSSGDYVLAKPTKLHHARVPLQESLIVAEFDNDNPEYFITQQAISILSGTIIAVTSGIRITISSFPADLAALNGTADLSVKPTAVEHGMPREFHELWARAISIEYKCRNGVKLGPKELAYENDLEQALEDFSVPNYDEEIVGRMPASDNNDGFDL